MLAKGSLYIGTDEGAENLIKMDEGSEYIIDLMDAPGTLIPAELPSKSSSRLCSGSWGFFRSSLEEAISVGFQPKHHRDNNKAENSEHKFEKPVHSAYRPTEASPLSVEGLLLAQEQKVKSVSKYVISAAKNPEFA
ncbi:hypothetical protein Nepgr_020287 [Nepenthes gracilis]|uniref:EDR1/CTR1/ARMC3-like peptidase-like domain-containing protein n=1 Tax=Nepenthes gracilis TaxID=150966 RepID=A0AAD3SX20_NEPGR|nr:hypothetical protein Nepgr_020287 [Nepenthes gracilis]